MLAPFINDAYTKLRADSNTWKVEMYVWGIPLQARTTMPTTPECTVFARLFLRFLGSLVRVLFVAESGRNGDRGRDYGQEDKSGLYALDRGHQWMSTRIYTGVHTSYGDQ